MGQYHIVANLDKKQTLMPHKLGCGLKLWEQVANQPGTGSALLVLLASASNGAGGGDLRANSPVIGSWRGDRLVMVGDYDDQSRYLVGYDKSEELSGAEIYSATARDETDDSSLPGWTDISDEVCAVLEVELDGKFVGDGWRDFVPNT